MIRQLCVCTIFLIIFAFCTIFVEWEWFFDEQRSDELHFGRVSAAVCKSPDLAFSAMWRQIELEKSTLLLESMRSQEMHRALPRRRVAVCMTGQFRLFSLAYLTFYFNALHEWRTQADFVIQLDHFFVAPIDSDFDFEREFLTLINSVQGTYFYNVSIDFVDRNTTTARRAALDWIPGLARIVAGVRDTSLCTNQVWCRRAHEKMDVLDSLTFDLASMPRSLTKQKSTIVQAFQMQMCEALIRKAEIHRGVYHHVIRTRPDLAFFGAISVPVWDISTDYFYNLATCDPAVTTQFTQDFFQFGRRDVMLSTLAHCLQGMRNAAMRDDASVFSHQLFARAVLANDEETGEHTAERCHNRSAIHFAPFGPIRVNLVDKCYYVSVQSHAHVPPLQLLREHAVSVNVSEFLPSRSLPLSFQSIAKNCFGLDFRVDKHCAMYYGDNLQKSFCVDCSPLINGTKSLSNVA